MATPRPTARPLTPGSPTRPALTRPRAPCPTPRSRRPRAPNAYDLAHEEWRQLRKAFSSLLRGQGPRPWELPEPASDEELCRAVATLLSPKTRPLMQQAFLDLLGEDIVRIALAAKGGADAT